MTDDFQLHPRLAADCLQAGRFALCDLLMMNDAQYPWFILVPRRPRLQEIYQLTAEDRAGLLAESCALGEGLMRAFGGDKLNVAALGNVVPQLHLHHIVRFKDDPAWPGPVWGVRPPVAMDPESVAKRMARLASAGVDGLTVAAG